MAAATTTLDLPNRQSPLAARASAFAAAGVAATLIWEAWARGAAPLWIGGPLEPTGLIQSVFGKLGMWGGLEAVFGTVPRGDVAAAVHLLTGLVFYPMAYFAVARPLALGWRRRVGGRAPILRPLGAWSVAGALFGAATFVFAMYVMAHVIAGFPPFFNWGALAQASLVGHVLYGLTLAGVARGALGR